MRNVAIKVSHVSKTFKLPHERHGSIKNIFVNIFRNKKTYEKQQVLSDISFDIKQGEFFGIVGRNGSGKSTLLKLLAGVYSPDKGAIQVNGKLTPFIELGVGFNPELTGRENVFLNGALLGFNRTDMESMYDDIVEFAELEKFMDQKLKNYSSGMQVRLAFSIAIRAESDILLLDEVLAVGDAIFQKKCFDYFKKLKKEKRTVVLVSHDSSALTEYCDRGILIEAGDIVATGPIDRVVNEYNDILNTIEESSNSKGASLEEKSRWGSGEIEVTEINIINSSRKTQNVFTDKDEDITISVSFVAKVDTPAPVYGITIADASGQKVFASNTLWTKVVTRDLKAYEGTNLTWKIPNHFNTGSFSVTPAAANRSGTVIYDWRDELASFKVRKKIHSNAFINAEHETIVDQEKTG